MFENVPRIDSPDRTLYLIPIEKAGKPTGYHTVSAGKSALSSPIPYIEQICLYWCNEALKTRAERDHYQREVEMLRGEIEELRGLVRQLVNGTERHLDKPYARHPPMWCWECIYCEHEWQEDGQEYHADDCPITLARAALEGEK